MVSERHSSAVYLTYEQSIQTKQQPVIQLKSHVAHSIFRTEKKTNLQEGKKRAEKQTFNCFQFGAFRDISLLVYLLFCKIF